MHPVVFAEPRYRFVAMVLDLLVVELISDGVSWIAFDGVGRLLKLEPSAAASLVGELGIAFVTFVAYQVVTTVRWGATPGKRVFKIRVVDSRHLKPVGWGRALFRAVAWIPSYLPFCMGLALALLHPERRGVPDLIAGTACLRDRRTSKT